MKGESMTTLSAGEICARHKSLLDQKDALNAQLKELNKQIEASESEAMELLTAHGLDKVSGAGITLYTREKWRAKYDPELWGELVKWAASSGRTDLIQRRLSDAKVLEYVDSGADVPPGLSVEAYTALEFRRS